MRSYKYFYLIVGIFAAVLILSNTASTKIVDLGLFTFDGGTILFPLAYIFGDILTEVYGYRNSRKVIWTGFACLALATFVYYIVGVLPAAVGWDGQDAYMKILGIMPRIAAASLVAYFAGEFSNSYILAKMKIWMKGKMLWVRTIGSTLLGEGVDTLLFVIIAFYGTMPNALLVSIIVSNYVFKVLVEVLFTPVTYAVVGWLKRNENEDYYDYQTNFNPFAVRS
jgi:hypothetical protein